MTRGRRLGFVLVLAFLIGGLAVVAWWLPRRALPSRLWGSEIRTIQVAGQPLQVLVAHGFEDGLRGVADLGGLDGMLFVFAADTTAAFGMDDVPVALDVAWFDRDGQLIDTETMATCLTSCPSYESPAAYRFALETREARLGGFAPGAVLTGNLR